MYLTQNLKTGDSMRTLIGKHSEHLRNDLGFIIFKNDLS